MQITNEAKKALESELSSNGCNCLKATMQRSCCGSSLMFTLDKLAYGQQAEVINGISVIFDGDAKASAESVLMDVQNGEIVVRNIGGCCCC